MKQDKIDKRFNGYHDFRNHAKFLQYNESELYFDVRNWCWEQWGPSSEWDLWLRTSSRANPAWCWIYDEYSMRILFASSKEYQWFLLKWS